MAPTFQVAFPIVLLVLLVLLPFIDRTPHRGWRNRPIALVVVVLLVVGVLVLTGLRVQSSWTGRPSPEPPSVPQGVILATEAEHGRQLFARYGCNSCHSVAGSGGASIGSDLARLQHRYSQAELRQYVLQPPRSVAMPSYAGRITQDDLESVVGFVLVAQTFQRTQE
jgi:ubiquinol-cytochrome c reductase cytochrome b subunit